MNKVLTITKLNISQIKTAYFIIGLVFLLMLVSFIINVCIGDADDNTNVSMGNTFALLPVFAAIFIPARNLRKTMNLGVRRNDFFRSCIPIYAILSAAVTLIMFIFHFTVDRIADKFLYELYDMSEVFGYYSNGIIIAFFQMFAFLLLVAAFTHTLTLAQTAWYGWVADILIVAIISVFTPIAPLRAAEAKFFYVIMFADPAIQISACLVLTAAFYALSKPVLNRVKM